MTLHFRVAAAIGFLAITMSPTARTEDCGCYSQCIIPGSESAPFPEPACMSQCQLECDLAESSRSSSSAPPAKVPDVLYGAIARSSTNRIVSAFLEESADAARRETLRLCLQEFPGASCSITNEFKNTCAAVFHYDAGKKHLIVVGKSGDFMSRDSALESVRAACDREGGCTEGLYVCSTQNEYLARQKARELKFASAALAVATAVFDSGTPQSGSRHDHSPTIDPTAGTRLFRSRTFDVTGNHGGSLLGGAPPPDEDWGPPLTPGGPNLFQILFREPGNRKFLVCDYREAGDGVRTETFAFWYQEPPQGIEQLLSIDSRNSLAFIGVRAYQECPATFGEAKAARQAAIDYTGSPARVALRERMAADIRARKARARSESQPGK